MTLGLGARKQGFCAALWYIALLSCSFVSLTETPKPHEKMALGETPKHVKKEDVLFTRDRKKYWIRSGWFNCLDPSWHRCAWGASCPGTYSDVREVHPTHMYPHVFCEGDAILGLGARKRGFCVALWYIASVAFTPFNLPSGVPPSHTMGRRFDPPTAHCHILSILVDNLCYGL